MFEYRVFDKLMNKYPNDLNVTQDGYLRLKTKDVYQTYYERAYIDRHIIEEYTGFKDKLGEKLYVNDLVMIGTFIYAITRHKSGAYMVGRKLLIDKVDKATKVGVKHFGEDIDEGN